MTNEEMQRAMDFIIQQQAQYAGRFDKDEARLTRLEEYFKTLVEVARGTDERLDTMDQTMATLSHTMNKLIQSMITTDARLTEAQRQTDLRLTEAQRQTDLRLTEAQIRVKQRWRNLPRLSVKRT